MRVEKITTVYVEVFTDSQIQEIETLRLQYEGLLGQYGITMDWDPNGNFPQSLQDYDITRDSLSHAQTETREKLPDIMREIPPELTRSQDWDETAFEQQVFVWHLAKKEWKRRRKLDYRPR